VTFWKKKNEEGIDTNNVTSEAQPMVLGQSSVDTTEKSGSTNSSLSAVEDRLSQRYGKARSALGVGTVIQGRLSFDTPVRIDGKLSGDVTSTKAVIVGQTGIMEAQIQVASLVVLGGVVKGDIKATERVEILQGGKIDGTITTPSIFVEEGSVINGSCNMLSQVKTSSQTTNKENKSSTQKEDSSKKEVTNRDSSTTSAPSLH